MLLSIIFLGAMVALYFWRRAQTRRRTRVFEAKNSELQQFLNDRTERLRQLLEDPAISPADLKDRADTIVAEMEARNSKGDLNPFITDTKEYLASKIDKRGVA